MLTTVIETGAADSGSDDAFEPSKLHTARPALPTGVDELPNVAAFSLCSVGYLKAGSDVAAAAFFCLHQQRRRRRHHITQSLGEKAMLPRNKQADRRRNLAVVDKVADADKVANGLCCLLSGWMIKSYIGLWPVQIRYRTVRILLPLLRTRTAGRPRPQSVRTTACYSPKNRLNLSLTVLVRMGCGGLWPMVSDLRCRRS